MLAPAYPPTKVFTKKVCSKEHGGCGKLRQMPVDDDICGQCLFAWSLAKNRPLGRLKNLRKIRRAKDITQAELARRAHVSESAIGRQERGGVQHAHKDIANSLARVLGVRVTELVGED